VRTLASSPSLVAMKSRLPKRTYAPGTHPMSWQAIQGLVMEATKRAKAPYLARQLLVSRNHRLVIYVIVRLGSDG
jgi:hypothetical protein